MGLPSTFILIAFAVGLADLSIKLIADDKPRLVLGDVDLEAGRWLGEPDQLEVVDMAGEIFRRRTFRRWVSLPGGRRSSGPSGPLP